ncbi:uncharacterized protein LOC126999174 [Eriocheir sinensis]|uniref:uncharacterized protein LOC126999174 n=1 Tax=Eriocheir sinensis TaxID=95602 RepID=UPI0021C74665|nr:uncharacterized protein LOC126999174 [Eriocheir sinensis]
MEKNKQITAGLWNLEKADDRGENGVWAADVGVSVVGVSTLMSPDVGVFRKVVWGVTLGMSLLVLVGVMAGQIARFFSYPVNMDVQIFYNDSLVSPAITICPSPRGMAVDLNPLAVQEEYQNLFQQRPYPGLKEAIMVLKKELDAKELWDRVGWNMSAMIERCFQGRGRLCEEAGEFIKTYTIFGACVTYKGDPATLPGSYHGLYLRLGELVYLRPCYLCLLSLFFTFSFFSFLFFCFSFFLLSTFFLLSVLIFLFLLFLGLVFLFLFLVLYFLSLLLFILLFFLLLFRLFFSV